MKIAEKFAAKSKTDDDNLVPLINVVFLMLVFFMVAGQIRKADPAPVIPPTSINDHKATSDPNLVIVVGQDKQIYLDDQPVALEQITPLLSKAFDAAPNKKDFWLQIKADGNTDVSSLKPIFSQIRAAGLTKVSLATQLARGRQ